MKKYCTVCNEIEDFIVMAKFRCSNWRHPFRILMTEDNRFTLILISFYINTYSGYVASMTYCSVLAY